MTEDKIDLSQFVPKNFEMDPELHDLLPNGRALRNGMVVLIEEEAQRQNLELVKKNPSMGLPQALRWNRWMTVSNVEFPGESEILTDVTFVATYDDGTKKKIAKGVMQAWYVQLDSIPEDEAIYYTEHQIATMSDEQLESIRGGGLAKEVAELKEAMASLVTTSKIAWQGILEMLKEGIKSEADLLDEAAARLGKKDVRYDFHIPGDNPYFRKATVEDAVRNFFRKNRAFIDSKDVHSLNELHPMYNHYCDKVGFQWKLSRRDFMQHLKSYFRTYANVDVKYEEDDDSSFESDTQLIGFEESVENGLIGR